MLIRLIYPKVSGEADDVLGQNFTLSLMYLAALTPPEYEVEIVDERVREIPYNRKANLVGITTTVRSFPNAYEIARKYRALGVTVVFGGFYPSLNPEEAGEHCDALVIGEAELVWETLLSDFKQGTLKKRYKGDTLSDLKNLPVPRYDLCDPSDFYNRFPVSVTRGCVYRCSYCCLQTLYGKTYRKRPVDDVVNEIRYIKDNYADKIDQTIFPLSIAFADDNIWGHKNYSKELFKKMADINIPWFSEGSLTVDDELIQLAALSGCNMLYIGLESLNEKNIAYLNKKHNKRNLYEVCIEKLHNAGISVGTFFMLGLPHDDANCFDELVQFCTDNCVEFPMAFPFQPAPNTPQFKLQDWEGAADDLPAFPPTGMTKKEFRRRLVEMYRKLYSDEYIEKRLKKSTQKRRDMVYLINKVMQDDYSKPKWDDLVESCMYYTERN